MEGLREDAQPPAENGDVSAVAGTTEPVETEMTYPGELPDYGGAAFTVLNEANNFWTGAHNGIDFDDDSIEMLNLMLETLTIDIGVCTGITTGFMAEICNSLPTGSAAFASSFASQKQSMELKMDDLLKQD